ncbi:MAG: transposase [Candidatus Methanoperedens sp.]|nr:transposase [Candidatus Methanoperedens sp.]
MELRHNRHTVPLLSDHMVFAPKYRSKRLKGRTSRILRKEFPHLKEWCGEHMWAPSCFHGSVGNGWDVVSKLLFLFKRNYGGIIC